MKHNILQAALAALFAIHCSIFAAQAADYTVSVSYNGTTAAVTIPEGWFSYDANISALGLNGSLLRDENAERIYLLLEMEVLLSPEESMEYGSEERTK